MSLQLETGRATVKLVATLLGGVLILGSFVAQWVFPDAAADGDNFYAKVMAGIGAILLAVPLWAHAIQCLFSGHMHMDELVALAILAAFAMGDFQTAGIVAFFLLLSNLIESRTALGARAAIEGLMHLTPTKARRLGPGGAEQEIEAHNLKPGDVVIVRPGDNIPADGVIVKGHSTINESNITGESLPAEKAEGGEVFGGTSNLTGALQVRVTKAGPDTTLGRVQSLILDAERTRIPLMRLIDQYAAWYTPITLMIAGVVWFFTRDMGVTIALLIIACPCALILATPTAIVAALSAASRVGIYIKDVSNIEWARKLTAVVFDKTGTLTTGELAVTRLTPAPGVDAAELLSAAAAVERLSTHPVARAIVAVAQKARIEAVEATALEETPGKGVQARVNGAVVRVGRRNWVAETGVDLRFADDEKHREPEGLSTLFVARDGRALGWIGLEDRTRPEARQALDELRHAGVRQLIMVTGDRWSVARRVAKEMGCSDVQAEVLPQDKLALVSALKERGHTVAVVGDGVNDAPALAAGHLGIAMAAAGSDIAMNSASVALMSSDLRRLPLLVNLSRATTNVIWQNLVFGVCFIIAGETLILFKYIGPTLAAVAHMLSSAIVVFNSARMVRFAEHVESHMPRPRPAPAAPAPGKVALQPV
ncbi:MAG: cation-translocating P-type ATPase [Phycisphaerae bacterium]|nr:cation-translocating P-type ATPase [Phycisphaerae bacterium]MCZ2399511.1 cation-translocating P-type ATPase [Phycisphaerae bacterium]NUQ48881.1 cation-translocating P-type ATPase [Phycisphaerae bacterium]